MSKMQLHPLCTLFPRLEGAEFRALCDDIRANGLRQPIVVHDGMILDGGNRYRACMEAGVTPRFVKFDGKNLVSFVLSANLHRRHMSPGQQAAIVASATDWAKAQTHGGNRKTDQGEALHLETVAQRAAAAGATTRTQKDADKLVREAPALAKEVTQGKKSLYAAVKESKPLPKILPRRDVPSKSVAKPEVSVEDKLRAEVKSLRATVKTQAAELELTKGQLAEARDNARELADSLEAAMKSGEGDAAVAKEIKKLTGQIRVLESQRDQYMTKCNELVKQVRSLQRKAA